MSETEVVSYLIQSARKRAHLCAMLRPASKKHIRTMSLIRAWVLASRPAFPSLQLKPRNAHHYLCMCQCVANTLALYLQDTLE